MATWSKEVLQVALKRAGLPEEWANRLLRTRRGRQAAIALLFCVGSYGAFKAYDAVAKYIPKVKVETTAYFASRHRDTYLVGQRVELAVAVKEKNGTDPVGLRNALINLEETARDIEFQEVTRIGSSVVPINLYLDKLPARAYRVRARFVGYDRYEGSQTPYITFTVAHHDDFASPQVSQKNWEVTQPPGLKAATKEPGAPITVRPGYHARYQLQLASLPAKTVHDASVAWFKESAPVPFRVAATLLLDPARSSVLINLSEQIYVHFEGRDFESLKVARRRGGEWISVNEIPASQAKSSYHRVDGPAGEVPWGGGFVERRIWFAIQRRADAENSLDLKVAVESLGEVRRFRVDLGKETIERLRVGFGAVSRGGAQVGLQDFRLYETTDEE